LPSISASLARVGASERRPGLGAAQAMSEGSGPHPGSEILGPGHRKGSHTMPLGRMEPSNSVVLLCTKRPLPGQPLKRARSRENPRPHPPGQVIEPPAGAASWGLSGGRFSPLPETRSSAPGAGPRTGPAATTPPIREEKHAPGRAGRRHRFSAPTAGRQSPRLPRAAAPVGHRVRGPREWRISNPRESGPTPVPIPGDREM